MERAVSPTYGNYNVFVMIANPAGGGGVFPLIYTPGLGLSHSFWPALFSYISKQKGGPETSQQDRTLSTNTQIIRHYFQRCDLGYLWCNDFQRFPMCSKIVAIYSKHCCRCNIASCSALVLSGQSTLMLVTQNSWQYNCSSGPSQNQVPEAFWDELHVWKRFECLSSFLNLNTCFIMSSKGWTLVC